MDFICFSANHGRRYAINITDLVYIVPDPKITTVPGTLPSVIGLTMFRNELVPVVNMGLLLSNEVDDSFIMLVLDTVNVLAIMVTEIREVIRDQIPEDYEFLDINDIAQQVIAGPRSEEDQHIELF